MYALNVLKKVILSHGLARVFSGFFQKFLETRGAKFWVSCFYLGVFTISSLECSTISKYVISAVACANQPSHISALFEGRTVQIAEGAANEDLYDKQKYYLKEKLVKSQQSRRFWTFLCDLTKKIVRKFPSDVVELCGVKGEQSAGKNS